MTTRAIFDSATLADAVQKAARIAPTKGAAFDLAAGLLFEVDPATAMCILKSTNLDTTYRQVLSVTDAKGDHTTWRLPSQLLSGLVSNLPLGAGNTITFADPGDGAVRIMSGSVKAKLSTISGTFPAIPEFDTAKLSPASDFAHKVEQVSWACDKVQSNIMAGVHIDGEHLVACDRQAGALVPCVVPLDRAVTVPLAPLAPVLRMATDARMGATDRTLHLMLDAETQITAKIYEEKYPDVKAIRPASHRYEVELPRQPLIDAINRMLIVARAERMPVIKLTFTPGIVPSLVLDVIVPDTGRIQDSVNIGGKVPAEILEIWFTPGCLVGALDNAKNETVVMEFGPEDLAKTSLSMARFTDGKGYEALVMPRMP